MAMSKVPQIVTRFDSAATHPSTGRHIEMIRASLEWMFPDGWQQGELPIFKWGNFAEPPFDLSFQLLCRCRLNVSQFFFSLIRQWLLPGRQLEPTLLTSYDFEMPEISPHMLNLAEVVVRVESAEDLIILRRNLPILASEIRLGVCSAHHANRILEVKGLTPDAKTAAIQEHIGYLMRRRPAEFGGDLMHEMQHFLVMCPSPFREAHECRQMSRIICLHYHFRRLLREQVKENPDRRHIAIKVLRVHLRGAEGQRQVLGVFCGMNFLTAGEVCGSAHMMQAIRTFLPDVVAVDDSFLSNGTRGDAIRTLYLEVELNCGAQISSADLHRLRRGLPSYIKAHVEQKMHPIFMPRNEEEVLRHIVTLSDQLKYLRDLPQVIISYLHQASRAITFNVVVLRVLRPGAEPLKDILRAAHKSFHYEIESQRIVGHVRRRYPKEATVLRVSLPKPPFLRGDQSLDVYQGRQALVKDLELIFGEFRDFYGGMIQKQHELLDKVQAHLGATAASHQLVLENFFHALTPGVMRSVLQPDYLAKFFLLLIEGLDRRGQFLIRKEADCLYLMIIGTRGIRDELWDIVRLLDIPTIQLASVELTVLDHRCLGFLYRGESENTRQQLIDGLKQVVEQPQLAHA